MGGFEARRAVHRKLPGRPIQAQKVKPFPGPGSCPPDEVGYLLYLKKCTLVAEVVFPAGPPQKPGVEDGEATAAATFVCQK